jgi:hypothetical protein
MVGRRCSREHLPFAITWDRGRGRWEDATGYITATALHETQVASLYQDETGSQASVFW